MMRLLYALALGLTLGGLVHIASLLAVPSLARDSAYDRLSGANADGRFAVLADDGGEADALPFRDPAFVTAVCRYDLSRGSVTIRAALPSTYGVLSVHNRSGLPFYALTDRATTDGAVEVTILSAEDVAAAEVQDPPEGRPALRIVSPTPTGFVLVRLFASGESARPGLRDLASKASCGRAATRTLTP
ncbi:DUF1254 domain-containing protein [Hansschlegelia plantiphila]|uniref:DUF1254 domain-containing protein n=1 Tax=Hansschlegelia plantiphila TaxID=374655 RepID=A0A9W6MVG4_9HYPH|nr:hypothetical protein [Hansschlegelia plantiphila]GLK67871.1 DUF1254 domain-containing protein [Hansschlegelia plantiphila]